jgi:hypothetical protein
VFAKNKAKNDKWEKEWNQKDADRKAALAADAERKRRADCFPDLLEALVAISKFIPITTALDGGASAHSENVRAADLVRAAIAKATGTP